MIYDLQDLNHLNPNKYSRHIIKKALQQAGAKSQPFCFVWVYDLSKLAIIEFYCTIVIVFEKQQFFSNLLLTFFFPFPTPPQAKDAILSMLYIMLLKDTLLCSAQRLQMV